MSRRAELRLRKSNAVWLGVCSGIAAWLGIPAALARTIFVVGVLLWTPLILGYFVMYYCMDRDVFRDRTWDELNPSRAAEHLRKLDYRKPIHRNTRDKCLAGVCAGLADSPAVNPFWLRLLAVLSVFVFGPFTIIAYVVAIFLLDPDPFLEEERWQRWQHRRRQRRARRRAKKESRAQSQEQYERQQWQRRQKYWEQYREKHRKPEADEAPNSQDEAPGREPRDTRNQAGACASTFRELEKRLRSIESYMTSKRFRLHCEIKRA